MIDIIEVKSSGKCIGKCECGKIKEFYTSNIKRGRTKSCGCLKKSNIPSEIRRTFNLMNYRCNTETSPDYERWGGRGVRVLYNNVEEFYKDVGDKPSKNHSIDRIDGSKGYEKGNCRWATSKEQSNNISSNVIVCLDDKEYTIAQLADKYNIKYTTLKERLKRGWSVSDAVNKIVETKFYRNKS